MKTTRTTLLNLLLVISFGALAQNGMIRKADKHFENFSYAEAILDYEGAVTKGAEDASVASKLAMSYWKIRDLDRAEEWYARAVSVAEPKALDVYRYSEVLRSNAKFGQADVWMAKYQEMAMKDARTTYQGNAMFYGPYLMGSSTDNVVVENLDANSDKMDMSPMIHDNELYFATARLFEFNSERIHTWNDQPFMELVRGTISDSGQVKEVVLVDDVNTRYHESNPSFSPESEIYITRNNFHNGKKQLTEDKINNLKIFKLEATEDGWGNETSFPYNSNDHSVGHPALSHDGKTMYFTSDMPGGFGGTDIWSTTKENGTWSEPKNIGRPVNTPGNEMFPYVHKNGFLFFSSDGQMGLGGLDILFVDLSEGEIAVPTNPGAPINSGDDDFSIVLTEEGKEGYFTSNRVGGKGDDDIYFFKLGAPLQKVETVSGIARDANSLEPLRNAEVDIRDENGNVIATVRTNDNGEFAFQKIGVNETIYEDALDDRVFSGFVWQLLPNDARSLRETDLSGRNSSVFLDFGNLSRNTVEGIALNDSTSEPLANSELDVFDENGKLLAKVQTDDEGKFEIPQVLYDAKVASTVDELGYAPAASSDSLNTASAQGANVVKFGISDTITEPTEPNTNENNATATIPVEKPDPNVKPTTPSGELSGAGIPNVEIAPIYFDWDDASIRSDAQETLEHLVQVMNDYPHLHVELRSHTDSRGSNAYNDALSRRRMVSTRKWLVKNGIDANRLNGKGYGERQLVNDCRDSVPCKIEQHKLNRRTEFVLTNPT